MVWKARKSEELSRRNCNVFSTFHNFLHGPTFCVNDPFMTQGESESAVFSMTEGLSLRGSGVMIRFKEKKIFLVSPGPTYYKSGG